MVVISDSAKGHISTNWQQKPLFLGIIVKKTEIFLIEQKIHLWILYKFTFFLLTNGI